MERSRFITVALVILSVFTAINGKETFGLSTGELFVLCLIGTMVHVCGLLCSKTKILHAVSPIVSFSILLLVLLVVSHDGSLLQSVPTFSNLLDLYDNLQKGIVAIKSGSQPFDGSTEIFLVCIVGIWCIAETAETIAQRLHSAIPTLAVYVFVNACFNGFYLPALIVLGFASWFFIYSYHRSYETSRSHVIDIAQSNKIQNSIIYVGLVLVIIASSLVLVLPAKNLPSLAPENAFDFLNKNNAELSPLVDMRALLQGDTNDIMFEANADSAQYWRVVVLNSFSNERWSLTPLANKEPEQIPNGIDAKKVQATVTMRNLSRKYLPTIYTTSSITDGDIESLEGSVTRGKREDINEYSLTANVAPTQLTEQQTFNSSDEPPKSVDSSTLIPVDFDPEIISLAKEIADENIESTYAQVIGLQNYFTDGSFTYDINADFQNEKNPMRKFLDTKRGFCEQFAATYAAMARSIGIPARVVVGFSPGEPDANGKFTMREKQAHSWVEVYLSNFGWLTVDPTPKGNQPGQAPSNIGATVVTTPTTATTTQSTAPVQSQPASTAKQSEAVSEKQSSNLPTYLFIVLLIGFTGIAIVFTRKKLATRDTDKYLKSTFRAIGEKTLDVVPIDLTIAELNGQIPKDNKHIKEFLDLLSINCYSPESSITTYDLRKAAEKARGEKISSN